jgi:hypothetical protein
MSTVGKTETRSRQQRDLPKMGAYGPVSVVGSPSLPTTHKIPLAEILSHSIPVFRLTSRSRQARLLTLADNMQQPAAIAKKHCQKARIAGRILVFGILVSCPAPLLPPRMRRPMPVPSRSARAPGFTDFLCELSISSTPPPLNGAAVVLTGGGEEFVLRTYYQFEWGMGRLIAPA